MIAPCDGCHTLFDHSLERISAKEIFPRFCKVPLEDALTCTNAQCLYCIEGDGCAEFQFCDKCLKDKALVKRTFEEFAKLLGG